jgi:hypothetical protein
VTLDVLQKKRGEHEADIACAAQIPGMMIHTCLKSAQAVERKTFNPSKVKITCQSCDEMEVSEWCLAE